MSSKTLVWALVLLFMLMLLGSDGMLQPLECAMGSNLHGKARLQPGNCPPGLPGLAGHLQTGSKQRKEQETRMRFRYHSAIFR